MARVDSVTSRIKEISSASGGKVENNFKEPPSKTKPEDKEEQRTNKSVSQEELSEALSGLNSAIEVVDRGLEFSVHQETNRVMVKVIDKAKDEVVREIPPEKILDMLAQIRDLIGVLVDERA